MSTSRQCDPVKRAAEIAGGTLTEEIAQAISPIVNNQPSRTVVQAMAGAVLLVATTATTDAEAPDLLRQIATRLQQIAELM